MGDFASRTGELEAVEESAIESVSLKHIAREAAHAAAVRIASWFELLHPRTWAATRETRKRGYRIHRVGKRVKQLGGTFVIGPGPCLLYEHVDADSTDHAPLERVLHALPER